MNDIFLLRSDEIVEKVPKGVINKDRQPGSLRSIAFSATVPKLGMGGGDDEYVLKIAGEETLFYTHMEIKAFGIMNQPPTVPNIPKLAWSAEVTRNPYATWEYDDFEEYFKPRGLSIEDIKWLKNQIEISVEIVENVPHTGLPNKSDLPELSRFMSSLLRALSFAHSHFITNNDIAKRNVRYDKETGTTYLFDWSDMRIYEPHGKTYLNPFVSMEPPEARDIDLPVHVTVSAFDVYSAGVMLNKILCGHTECDNDAAVLKSDKNNMLWQAHDLANKLMTQDPFERPSAEDMLNHEFLVQ